jgi:hypothetical protein
MNVGPTFYCWYCYSETSRPNGACAACGEEIEGPGDADYGDRLLWALRHPLLDRRLLSATMLGVRRETRAVEPLRALLSTENDPYLAAAALKSLVQIDGVDQCRDVLDHAIEAGPAPARRAARQLLTQAGKA